MMRKKIVSQPPSARQPDYLKVFLFVMIGLMILVVTYNKMLFYRSEVPSAFRTQMLSIKQVLIPHIVFSMVGLLVGPVLFSSRFRARNRHLHKILGRVYVVSILLGGILALVITFISYSLDNSFAVQGLVQAGSWLLTTTVAWIAARNRQITLHKIWMARSYGVTFIAVASRFLNSYVPFINHLSQTDYTHFLWFLNVLALLVPDLLVTGKSLLTRPTPIHAPKLP